MSDKFILVVSDEGEDRHGEIAMLDTSHEAERRVEALLEAGFSPKRIQVFAGGQASVVVSYRPSVLLMEGDSDESTSSIANADDRVEPDLAPVGAGAERSPLAPNGGNGTSPSVREMVPVARTSPERVSSGAELGRVSARAYDDTTARQGHFSDLFRPAYMD